MQPGMASTGLRSQSADTGLLKLKAPVTFSPKVDLGKQQGAEEKASPLQKEEE